MKPKRRWLLLLPLLALFAWAYQAASWRPKLVGVQTTQSTNTLLLIWNVDSLKLLISPDGKMLVSVAKLSNKTVVTMWTPESSGKLWQQSTPNVALFPLAFSPDNQKLVMAEDKSVFGRSSIAVYTVDAATGKGKRVIKTLWQSNVQSAAFLSDKQLVIATTQGATVVDTQTGKAIRQWNFKLPTLQNTKLPLPNQSHVSADGKTVIVLTNGSFDSAVATYDVATGKQRAIWNYKYVVRNPRLSPDGTLWAMQLVKDRFDGDGWNVYDANNGQKLWGAFSATNYEIWAWSADSQMLVLPKEDGHSIFQARERRYIRYVPSGNSQSLALDPRGDYFYTLDNQGKIWRWRAR